MTDDELYEKAQEALDSLATDFGYEPYILTGVDNGKILATCPFCGDDLIFDSLDEFRTYSSIPTPSGEVKPTNSCPACTKSKMDSKNGKYDRYLNVKCLELLCKVLEEKFDSKVIMCKSNIYADPFEKVRFKVNSTGEKWEVPLFVILNYDNLNFSSIQLDEDQISILNAQNVETKMKRSMNRFCINPSDELEIGDPDEEEDNSDSESSKDDNESEDYENSSEPEDNESPSEDPISESETSEDDDTDEVESDEEKEKEIEKSQENVENKLDEIENENIIEDDIVSDESITSSELEESVAIETDEDDEIEEDTDKQTKIDQSNEELEENEITEEDLNESEDVKEEEKESVSESETSEDDDTDEVESDEEKEKEIEKNNEKIEENKKEIEYEKTKEEPKKEKNNNFKKLVLDLGHDNGLDFNPFGYSSESKKEESESVSEEKVVEEKSDKDDRPHLVLDLGHGETNDSEETENVEEEQNEESESSEIDDEEEEEVSFSKGPVLDLSKDGTKKDYSRRYSGNKIEEERDDETDYVRHAANKARAEENKWYNKCIEFNDDDPSFNEFIDEVDLHTEFMSSAMGKLIKAVYEKCQVTNPEIQSVVVINEKTLELPFVDFSTGVRVICIDTNNMNQLLLPVGIFENKVEFSFVLPNGKHYEKCYLYGDMLSTDDRTKATVRNLTKIVNKKHFDPKRIVNLGGNYTLFYTDDVKTIREFEAVNSSYPYGKPSTKSIAIIALRSINGQKTEFTQKDMLSWASKSYQFDLKSFNMYMVASARYIVRPNHKAKIVEYRITDYTEISSTILKDGLSKIVAAIVKEHNHNRTINDKTNLGIDFSTYNYSFEFEFDSASLESPSLEIWCDNSGFKQAFINKFEDGQGNCYIRKPENRTIPSDGYRIDSRYFLPASFQKKFSAEIVKANINVLHEPSRLKFVERLGFVSCYYPRTKTFMLNPVEVIKSAFDPATAMMQKIDISAFFAGSGVYDGGYDNLLMQKFLMSKIGGNMDENTRNMMNFIMMSNFIKK